MVYRAYGILGSGSGWRVSVSGGTRPPEIIILKVSSTLRVSGTKSAAGTISKKPVVRLPVAV